MRHDIKTPLHVSIFKASRVTQYSSGFGFQYIFNLRIIEPLERLYINSVVLLLASDEIFFV